MNKLPIDVLARIFDSFSLDERAKLRSVNRLFKEAIEYGLFYVRKITFSNYMTGTDHNSDFNYVQVTDEDEVESNYIDDSFWSFANRYLGPTLKIRGTRYFSSEELTTVGSKLRFIECLGVWNSSENKSNFFTNFPLLEGFKFLFDGSQSLTFPYCNSLLANSRINDGEQVVYLSLPCRHSFDCRTQITQLPIGLKSLTLNFNVNKQLPLIPSEVAASLIELEINGLPKVQQLNSKFKSLKKLSIFTPDDSNEKKLLHLIEILKMNINHIQSFILVAAVTRKTEKLIYNLLSLGNKLKRIGLLFKYFWNEFLSNLDDKDKDELVYIKLPSTNLKNLTLTTFSKISVSASSSVLHSVEINASSIDKFDLNFSRIVYFKLYYAEVNDCLSSKLHFATKLKYLHLRRLILNNDSFSKILESLKFMKSIERIYFASSFHKNREIVSFNLNDSFEEKVDLKLIDVPNLKSIHSFGPELTIILPNKFKCLELTRSHDAVSSELFLTNIYGQKSSFFSSSFTFKFDEQMTKLINVNLNIHLVKEEVINILQYYCHNVTNVKIVGLKLNSIDLYLETKLLMWIKSLDNLQSLIGSFSQQQLNEIMNFAKSSRSKLSVLNFTQ